MFVFHRDVPNDVRSLGSSVAAVVIERARRIADLAEPSAAFGEGRGWGARTVTAPIPELAGFEIVLATPETAGILANPGEPAPGFVLADAASDFSSRLRA